MGVGSSGGRPLYLEPDGSRRAVSITVLDTFEAAGDCVLPEAPSKPCIWSPRAGWMRIRPISSFRPRAGNGTGSRPAFRRVISQAFQNQGPPRKLSGDQPPATTVFPALCRCREPRVRRPGRIVLRPWSRANGSAHWATPHSGGHTKRPLPDGTDFGSMSPSLPGCWPSTGKPPAVSDRSSS